ncbi:MAG: T9SS type A sorting domain-containing protein [Gemmatimonadetes bacterium]|jgi:hypothetical protein|nr:T9SS type A sorting domain-containing protein [Gemmatimonadota bacterium]
MARSHSYRSITRPFVFFCCSLLWTGSGIGQPYFTDVTRESWDVLTHSGAFPAWGDYDNDGRPDLFLGEILAHNEGDGRFGAQPLPEALISPQAIFGDYDNDGDLDLFSHPPSPGITFGQDALGRNDGGVFTDVSLEAGLTDTLPSMDTIWLDYDQDGFIDLYECNTVARYWEWSEYTEDAVHLRNKLYHNNGDGTFTEATEAAGLGVLNPGAGTTVLGLAAADFTNDGWPDLYVGVNNGPNRLFHNDGQGRFQDATTEDIAAVGPSAGVAVGDIDNDGDLDIFQATNIPSGRPGWRSVMLLNWGDGTFMDVTEGVGLTELSKKSRFGPSLVDIDNDGDLDLAVSNPPATYLNDGSGLFVDHSTEVHVGLTRASMIAAWGDYDLDGFLDVFSAGGSAMMSTLLRRRGNDNHWLRVELVGIQSNRTGIGARLIATAGDLRQIREILGGLGEQQDEMVAHFGLGGRTQVDELEIRWPSGQVDVLMDIPADQKIRVFEGREGYHAVQPTRWEHSLPDEVTRKTQRAIEIAVWPAFFDPDATITRVTADLSKLGGPADLLLEADEDGVYRLDSSLEIDALRGTYTAFVNIEQQTSLGDHWVQLSKRLTVLPDEDVDLFGGGGREDWTWHGQELTRVTEHPDFDAGASWSPDGTRLCFHTERDGNFEIYVIGTDGSAPVNLTRDPADDPAKDKYPHWSPDGMSIAFHSDRDGNFEIYVMDADGGNPTNLTMSDSEEFQASWSPDGTRIAFSTDRDDNREVYAMDADGGNPINLTNHDEHDSVPSWSPDGNRIAFHTDRNGNSEIYVMDADGSNPVNLTRDPAQDFYPAWSPDGTQIAFESYRNSIGPADVYVMGANGTDPSAMIRSHAHDMEAAWSPDGNRIAFASNRTGNFDLFLLTPGDASRVEIDPQERGTVFTGNEALAVRAGSDWWLSCQPTALFDWTGYAALRFAFHPGDLSASAGEELSVWIRGKEVDLLSDGRIDLTAAKWQVMEIPFEQFELKEPIAAIDFSGDFTGSFYIDDLRLVPAKPSSGSTAVVEDRAAGRPLTFALKQNYPNPFNAGTVIRFALPERRDIELSIFNLAGQRVATLTQGMREAGTYTVRWDGRDDDGRELASGVYLYRLRTDEGQQMETQKLVLVR